MSCSSVQSSVADLIRFRVFMLTTYVSLSVFCVWKAFNNIGKPFWSEKFLVNTLNNVCRNKIVLMDYWNKEKSFYHSTKISTVLKVFNWQTCNTFFNTTTFNGNMTRYSSERNLFIQWTLFKCVSKNLCPAELFWNWLHERADANKRPKYYWIRIQMCTRRGLQRLKQYRLGKSPIPAFQFFQV